MTIKRLLSGFLTKVVRRASEIDERTARDRHNVDLVLSQALRKASRGRDVLFPVAYAEFLRGCVEATRLTIRQVKADSLTSSDTAAKRFASLVSALRNVPPIEFAIAEEIGLIADSYRGNLTPIEGDDWAGDVWSHFETSSSFATKGRILTTVIRLTQSKQCLELGTAYGMAALFILEALKKRGTDTHLTTLEGWEPQFSLSSKILRSRYGNHVSCEHGRIQEALPGIVKSLEPLDFLFHDAGHSREDYVNDFHAIVPILAPGAVVLIDDIRWEHPRSSQRNSRCYEGWSEVLNHHRVRRAVEIDDAIGLLLLGG